MREVVLFADTFNRYFERENLDAALSVLVAARLSRACGVCRRTATRGRCAAGARFSRSARSDQARREMERTLAALAPYVSRGMPVIGLEPSCLLSFRDEMPALIKSDAADALAAQALLLEEFLAREQKEGR